MYPLTGWYVRKLFNDTKPAGSVVWFKMHITLEITVQAKSANFRFTVPTFTWKDCKNYERSV